MDLLVQHKIEFAVFIARLVAGILFFSQGYDKVFRIHLRDAGNASVTALHSLGIPPAIIRFTTFITAVAELTCGLLLITGFMIIPAAYVLACCILPITIAMSWKEPMWNLGNVWPRMVLIVFLLMVPVRAHTFALDYIVGTYAG